MPVYVFECLKCSEKYEDLTSYDETGKYKKVKCPYCKSKKKNKLPTCCMQVVFTNPRGTSKADNFSYVAGYNMAQAKEERRRAETASHMGTQPYNEINDLVNDKNFGKVV
jgi:DNA-directed RNA polymerase subunit RPC12/RpoP